MPSAAPEPIPQVIEKAEAYLKWKAESMRANFKVRCNQDIKFELAEGVLYAVGSDFESCRDTNKALSDVLPAQPTICVVGDCTGAVSISCIAHLTPQRLVAVTHQNVKSQAVLDDNVSAFVIPTETEWRVGGSSTQTYAQYMSDRALWETGKYSSHSSHPWEYFKNLAVYWSKKASSASNKHFDLLIYEEVWNKAFQEKLRSIQGVMSKQTPEQNYNTPRDPALVNDLKFYDHETSPLEAMTFMDEFIIEPLFTAGCTCDVFVCKTRGMITDAVWEALKTNGSKLALNYTMTFEMEEIPNARTNRMNYNSHTGTTELQYDDHKHKYVDVNGGVHSKFYTYIFQKNADGLELQSFCYGRPGWYGDFFCCCDAKKKAIYVKTDTCHKPFTRISHEEHLKVIFGPQYKLLENEEERHKYFEVHPLRRKIEVQIEDLTFLTEIFDEYIKNYTEGITITESTTLKIKMYLAQAWYTYRVNDCIWSQSCHGDTDEKIQEGNRLIRHKIQLFTRVKQEQIPQIMQHNNWTEPLKLHLPWHPHDPYNPKSLHMQCDFHTSLSQLRDLSANWTLGDPDDDYDTLDKNAPDRTHRSEYEKAMRDGELSPNSTDYYNRKWGPWDNKIHNKGGNHDQLQGRDNKGRAHWRTGGQFANDHGADNRQGYSNQKAAEGAAKRQRDKDEENDPNLKAEREPGDEENARKEEARQERQEKNREQKEQAKQDAKEGKYVRAQKRGKGW
jgi:hypothetical protein